MSRNNEPIRIAQITWGLSGGGTDTMLCNYYRAIDKQKVQFDFFLDRVEDIPEDIKRMGCKIYHLPLKKRFYRNSMELLKNYKIVHSHLSTYDLYPLYVAKKAGVPIRISHSHFAAVKAPQFTKNLIYSISRLFLRKYPTHFFACSYEAGRWLFGKKFKQRENSYVVKNAISVSKFAFCNKKRDEARKELLIGKKPNSLVIGHIGRFCYQKNHEFLITVFKEILKKEPDSVLVLVGEGEGRANIEEKVRVLGLSENVMFLGWRNDADRLFCAMDVFVFPSRFEGLSLVLIEAQTSDLPVVASDKNSPDSDILEKMHFLPIAETQSNFEKWADEIINAKKERITDFESVKHSGYDISEAAKELCGIYEKLAGSSIVR
ncbi:MAG: glycosyltransferase [Chitinispirillales bacterium]|jgi:glycosyltransferase involved in cell wall biosynthesis|nr:glycosyltransferase [Chitinispirillales bacterium]